MTTTAAEGLPATRWPGTDGFGTSPAPAPDGGRIPTRAPLIFVIPVYDEEENVARLLGEFEARPWLIGSGSRLVLVDDGSRDRTPEIIGAYTGPIPLELVRLEHNRGPGAAFRAGFDYVLPTAPDDGFVVTLEGDTTSDLDALPAMLERVTAGADLVVASWRMVNVSRRRRLLSAGAGFMVRRVLGLNAHTVSSFFRVYRVSALRAANARYQSALIVEEGFACKAELLAKLAHMGMRIEEVPVRLDWARRAGKSKMPVAATIVGYWRVLLRARAAGELAGG